MCGRGGGRSEASQAFSEQFLGKFCFKQTLVFPLGKNVMDPNGWYFSSSLPHLSSPERYGIRVHWMPCSLAGGEGV